MSSEVAQIVEQVSRWSREQRLELFRSLDRLAALDCLEEIADKVHRRALADPLTDEDIDRVVREARRERPLHQR